jgi:hypothetical protein
MEISGIYLFLFTLVGINLLCIISFRTPNIHQMQYLTRKLQTANDGNFGKDPELQDYLSGSLKKPWSGNRSILKRKKQIPDAKYSPQEVVKICLDALVVNDDPQLDHGCLVVLEFKSPSGPLAEGKLDPREYGQFLRSSEYNLLLEYETAELVGEPKSFKDGLSVIQKVLITGWQDLDESSKPKDKKYYNFYLSKIDGKWLVDVILLASDNSIATTAGEQ